MKRGDYVRYLPPLLALAVFAATHWTVGGAHADPVLIAAPVPQLPTKARPRLVDPEPFGVECASDFAWDDGENDECVMDVVATIDHCDTVRFILAPGAQKHVVSFMIEVPGIDGWEVHRVNLKAELDGEVSAYCDDLEDAKGPGGHP